MFLLKNESLQCTTDNLTHNNREKTYNPRQMKRRSDRHKNCTLAVVRQSQKFSPHRRPPSWGHRTAKI